MKYYREINIMGLGAFIIHFLLSYQIKYIEEYTTYDLIKIKKFS